MSFQLSNLGKEIKKNLRGDKNQKFNFLGGDTYQEYLEKIPSAVLVNPDRRRVSALKHLAILRRCTARWQFEPKSRGIPYHSLISSRFQVDYLPQDSRGGGGGITNYRLPPINPSLRPSGHPELLLASKAPICQFLIVFYRFCMSHQE